MCFVFISEQTVFFFSTLNCLVFITESVYVYCAVRPGYLNKIEEWLNVYRVIGLINIYYLANIFGDFTPKIVLLNCA
jgi:hypothetical protein